MSPVLGVKSPLRLGMPFRRGGCEDFGKGEKIISKGALGKAGEKSASLNDLTFQKATTQATSKTTTARPPHR
jgi:hypothetical protein